MSDKIKEPKGQNDGKVRELSTIVQMSTANMTAKVFNELGIDYLPLANGMMLEVAVGSFYINTCCSKHAHENIIGMVIDILDTLDATAKIAGGHDKLIKANMEMDIDHERKAKMPTKH